MTSALVWFHRWLGIATCLIFAAWFASGAVLLFQPFPALSPAAAREMAPPVDLAAVRLAPADALRVAELDDADVSLIQRGDTPVYVIRTENAVQVIDARTGERAPPLDARQARSIGERATGPSLRRVTGPFAYDQWIVHNQFDGGRPYYRLDLRDARGTQLYLSAVTGEILQRTTARERGWNWVGAVLHWVYFTPLRSSFDAWDQGVWWLSLVVMLVSIAGIILGLLRTVAVRRSGRPGLTYFRVKWLRWHHLLGLFASVFVFGWILSGWLSMDHGRIFSRGTATAEQRERYSGLQLHDALAGIDLETLHSLPEARAIAFNSVGRQPIIVLSDAEGIELPYDASGRRLPDAVIDRLIRKALADAWPGAQPRAGVPVLATDTYALAEGMPAQTRRYSIGGGATDVYVNGSSGRIVTVMDDSRAAYAWVYYALHTFNVPGLTTRPRLREIVVMIPLTFGFLFSLTGVVVGFQRLKKTI